MSDQGAVSVYGSFKKQGEYKSTGTFDEFKKACRSIGSSLVRNGFQVIVCASHEESADRYVLEGALASARKRRSSDTPPILWMRERDNSTQNRFFEGLQAENALLLESRPIKRRTAKSRLLLDSLQLADKLIVIGGGLATATAADAATLAGIEVLPIGSFGGAAEELALRSVHRSLQASWSPRVLRGLETLLTARVDCALITIKDTEEDGLLEAISAHGRLHVDGDFHRGRIQNERGEEISIATICAASQGNIEAYAITQKVIADLAPRAILLVGIGGANPHRDAFFGDVVIGTDVTDFTVGVRNADGSTQFSSKGYPFDDGLVRSATALRRELSKEIEEERLEMQFDERNFTTTNGNARDAISENFRRRSKPRVILGPVAASDDLIKDHALVQSLEDTHRALLLFAMEAAGAAKAASIAKPPVALLEIRGVSDVVGYKKTERCVEHASRVAGLVATKFVRRHRFRT